MDVETMYLSMWILAESIKNAKVDMHIISGEMCIRNVSVLFEAERYRPHTIYVSYAEDSLRTQNGDVICINRNDYFIVHGSSLEKVYEEIQDAIDYYEEWDLQIRDKIEDGCSLQEVTDRASDVMKNMTAVMNAGFIIQAISGKGYAKDISEENLSELKNQAGLPIYHVTSYGDFLKDHLDEKDPYLFFEPVIGAQYFTRNILLNGWLWGFCFIPTDNGYISEKTRQLFQVFYSQILHWHEHIGTTAKRPEQNEVFMELLLGKSNLQKDELWEYMNRLGWSESDEKSVCVLKERFGNSLVYLRLIHQISQTFSDCYILELNGEIVLIVNTSHLPFDILMPQLQQILSVSNVHIGVSYPFQNLYHLPQHFEQANIALENAIEKNKTISYCSDCAISYTRSLINKYQSTSMEHPVLQKIRKYDEKHGTEFYITLREYITEERSILRTSEALNIHKNTLLYRLRRLQELFPMDLSDREERARLLLSFMLYSS